ncbi:hexamerin-1.1-like [Onthophagus taurus]|uniref:hexamerin-1.1-like n=1 Tax=Onthophagus taurus TaxID=166361 RepID=UPI000C201833|nr:hexamerin-1.1-like [Onthophagus taurus]
MKTILLVSCLFALALATPTPFTTKFIPKKYNMGDKTFMEREYHVFRLLKHVNQPIYQKEYVEIADTFVPWKNMDKFEKPMFVEKFHQYYETDILPRGEIFSVFYMEHLKPTIALFKMFYYANDFDTFFKTAVWARQHVNEGMWLYAFSVALVHRVDTFGIVPPPIYEIYPYYFFNTETITKAQTMKQMFNGKYPNYNKYEGFTIESNYSGWYMNLHPEQSLSYFMEDIGLNSFYYYYNIHYPFWMDGEEFGLNKDHRGAMYLWVHQQLLARYYLERLSNEFGEIEMMNFDEPIETGYYPSMKYPNGMEFPMRPNHVYVGKHWEYNHPHFSNFTNSYVYVKDFARRMRDSIDMGFVFTRNGTKMSLYDNDGLEILANMIQGTPDSPNLDFYGVIEMYSRHLLGYTTTPLNKYKVVPSAMEHFETCLRDPVFWQFYKWIMSFVYEYKSHLPYYTKKELDFVGVDVENMEFDRLTTYFEDFYTELGSAVYYDDLKGEPFKVRVKQERLNHKPYTYKITVNSKTEVEAIAKVFIGPKYDEYGRTIDINENRMNFFMIDKFMYQLKVGKNVITRNSMDNAFFINDRTTRFDLYKMIMGVLKGQGEFTLDGSEAYFGFPRRLALPMGKKGGMTYQMYVILYPYKKVEGEVKFSTEKMYPMVGTGGLMLGDNSFGYPFDRPINYYAFDVTNALFKDVVIYHVNDMDEMNTSTL